MLAQTDASGLTISAGSVAAILVAVITAATFCGGLLVRLTTKFVKLEATVQVHEAERGELRGTLAEIRETLAELKTVIAVLADRDDKRGGALTRNAK